MSESDPQQVGTAEIVSFRLDLPLPDDGSEGVIRTLVKVIEEQITDEMYSDPMTIHHALALVDNQTNGFFLHLENDRDKPGLVGGEAGAFIAKMLISLHEQSSGEKLENIELAAFLTPGNSYPDLEDLTSVEDITGWPSWVMYSMRSHTHDASCIIYNKVKDTVGDGADQANEAKPEDETEWVNNVGDTLHELIVCDCGTGSD